MALGAMLTTSCVLLTSDAARAAPFDDPVYEVGLGVRGGSFLVDNDTTGVSIAGHFDVGVRWHRFLLFGEYAVYDASDPPPTTTRAAQIEELGREPRDGLAHRLGGTLRTAFTRWHESDEAFELYAEAGLGVQHLRWDAGGTWTRRDFAFGIGASLFSVEPGKHAGATLGLTVLLSRRSDITGDEPAVCSGPCDTPTPPTGYDRSIMLDFTFSYGD